MRSAENVRVLLYPVDKYDRRKDVEFVENNGYTIDELELAIPSDVHVYTLSDFMDLCNNEEFNEVGSWITYINIIEE